MESNVTETFTAMKNVAFQTSNFCSFVSFYQPQKAQKQNTIPSGHKTLQSCDAEAHIYPSSRPNHVVLCLDMYTDGSQPTTRPPPPHLEHNDGVHSTVTPHLPHKNKGTALSCLEHNNGKHGSSTPAPRTQQHGAEDHHA